MLQQCSFFHIFHFHLFVVIYIPEYIPIFIWNIQWSFKKQLMNITYLLWIHGFLSCRVLHVFFHSTLEHFPSLNSSPRIGIAEREWRPGLHCRSLIRNDQAGMCVNLLVITNTLNIQKTAEICEDTCCKREKTHKWWNKSQKTIKVNI